MNVRRWSKDEDEYLQLYFSRQRAWEMAQVLGRTISAVHQRVRFLRLRPNYLWSDDELVKLKALYPTASKEVVIAALSRKNWHVIRAQAARLKLRRPPLNILFPAPKLTLSEAERGYIAGFLDGDGYLGFRPRERNGVEVNVSFANNNKITLEWIQSKVGGRIRQNGTTKAGNPAFALEIAARPRVTAILEAITPYLILKREKAEMMLLWCRQRGSSLWEVAK